MLSVELDDNALHGRQLSLVEAFVVNISERALRFTQMNFGRLVGGRI